MFLVVYAPPHPIKQKTAPPPHYSLETVDKIFFRWHNECKCVRVRENFKEASDLMAEGYRSLRVRLVDYEKVAELSRRSGVPITRLMGKLIESGVERLGEKYRD